MDARQYIDEYGSAVAENLAKRAGTNMAYFRQIANGHRNASINLADALVAASDGELDLMSLLRSTADRKSVA